jgi:hypothetical protein
MPVEEAKEWDKREKAEYAAAATAGEYPLFNPATATAEDWADWMLYADQLQLWDRYVREVVLVGTDYRDRESTIYWPGDKLIPSEQAATNQGDGFGAEAALGGGKSGGGADTSSRNIYNENRSLDDQLGGFFTAPVGDTRPGKQGQAVFDPAIMDNQSVALYQEYLTNLRIYEKQQAAFMKGLEIQLEQRVQQRASYNEWRESQMTKVLEFVEEWERQYEGKVTTIAGVRYELYRPDNVPQYAPRGANVVVTDYELTPYDILNEDGTLRGPSRQ